MSDNVGILNVKDLEECIEMLEDDLDMFNVYDYSNKSDSIGIIKMLIISNREIVKQTIMDFYNKGA